MDSHIGQRIKELRLRFDLTQEKLAKKADVSYTTLTKIEGGVIKNPSITVISKIASALSVPIEELIETGDLVETLEGKRCISRVLDDVYETLKDSGGEVFISGIDERKFLEADKSAIIAHIDRLAKAGITERLLARENDSFFFSGPQSAYRWVPENLFNPTPVYVYGNKVAIIVWGPPQKVIIIKNTALADAYRKQFLFIWERAAVPPQMTVAQNERERLEKAIVTRYGGRVASTTQKDARIFRDYLRKEKTKTYGNSWFYLCQAANGIGSEKLGLRFFDGDMLASIGIFNRSTLGGGWHFHIIHPVCVFDHKKILTLSKAMLELSGNPVFVKKISKEERDKLLNLGFHAIETYPWHNQAMEEDDTFPEQMIDIEETIRGVEGPGKRDLKDKHQRFLSKFGNQIRTENLGEGNRGDALKLVQKFFDYLEVKQLHISQPSDYDSMIFQPPLGANGKAYFSEVVYINNRPAAFYAAEPISHDSAGLFANVTLHQEIPYLSEYLIIHVCKALKKAGFQYLNLGGSETSSLFQFKEKFLPVVYNKMHWVVYKI